MVTLLIGKKEQAKQKNLSLLLTRQLLLLQVMLL